MPEVIEKEALKCGDDCGFGCTQKAFDLATKEATELCARLNKNNTGDQWKPHVWENWGWNYKAVNGCSDMRVNREGDSVKGEWIVKGYDCEIDLGPVSCSHAQFFAKAETPEDALGFAKQDVRGWLTASEEKLSKL